MEIITDSHEWMKKEGDITTVGITKKAIKEMGEIVFIDLPKVGQKLIKGEEAAVIESAKAAIDSYAPLNGEVIAINEALQKNPDLINEDPEGTGWMYQVAAGEGSGLGK